MYANVRSTFRTLPQASAPHISLLATPNTYCHIIHTNVAFQIKFIHFNIINSYTFARCAEHCQTCIVTNCSLWSLISALVAATSKMGGCPCTAPTGTDGTFSHDDANASSHRSRVGRLRRFSTTNTNAINAFVVAPSVCCVILSCNADQSSLVAHVLRASYALRFGLHFFVIKGSMFVNWFDAIWSWMDKFIAGGNCKLILKWICYILCLYPFNPAQLTFMGGISCLIGGINCILYGRNCEMTYCFLQN